MFGVARATQSTPSPAVGRCTTPRARDEDEGLAVDLLNRGREEPELPPLAPDLAPQPRNPFYPDALKVGNSRQKVSCALAFRVSFRVF